MKLGVVGSINMDMTIQTERIPLKGETLKGENLQYIPGGKGANQAVAMARLGAEVVMFGCVGADAAGQSILDNFKVQGVCTDFIGIKENQTTGIAMITVGEGDNTIIVVAGANNEVTIDYVTQIREELLSCDIVLLQHEIPQETNEFVINLCNEAGVKTILNPGPARVVKREIVEKLTYLTPNEHEARIIFGEENTVEEILSLYPEKLIITQGAKGVSTCTKTGECITIPARKANVVDTTGAGDTLNGSFAVAIGDGKSLINAMRFANISASLSTEKFGAQGGMPSKDEVLRELHDE